MNRLRGAGALITLVALTAGVPWLLLRHGAEMPSGRDLSDTWISDSTIFAVLTVAVWLFWAVFVAAVVNETVATIRRVPASRPPVALPVQRLAGVLVGALVFSGTIHPASAGIRAPLPAVTVSALEPPSPPPSPTPPEPISDPGTLAIEPADGEAFIEVQRGDTAWGLAERHLGDGMRWRELWEANQGRLQPDGRLWTDPQFLLEGWKLRVPDGQVPDPPSIHVVREGESLSIIARDVLGDPALADVIYSLNRGVEQPGGHPLEDPDRIWPGTRLRLPDLSVDSSQPPSDPTPDHPSPQPPEPEQGAGVDEQHQMPPSSTDLDVPDDDEPDPVDETDDGADSVPVLAGLGGGLVLVTALAVQIHRLRRRRGLRGAAVHRARLPAQDDATEMEITTTADVPLVRWAGQELAQLTRRLDRRQIDGTPLLVELSEDTGIEVLWSNPQPKAPAPWAVTDGGWAWRLVYDADAPVPPDHLPAGLPALVTIGHRNGRQLLLNLEAFGTLSVDGPAEQMTAWLRAVAVELGAGQDLSDAYVSVVGFDPQVDMAPRLQGVDVEEAAEIITSTLRSSSDLLASSHCDSTFTARLGSNMPLESTVVVAFSDPHEKLARAEIAPQRGLVLVIGNSSDGAAHIGLAPDGTAHLSPVDLRFEPVQLPADIAGQVDRVLTTLTETPESNGASTGHHSSNGTATLPGSDADGSTTLPTDVAVEIIRAAAAHDEARPPVEGNDQPTQAPAMVVQVLGRPTIPDRPDLGRRELIITAFLACRGGPVAASAVQDAVWGGRAVEPKTVWNLIGSTRRALGTLPDGAPVMPPADRVRSTLTVANGVTTDLDMMRAYARQAETTSSADAVVWLRRALDLVQGPPFDSPGYDWAYRDQHVADASTLIEATVERLVNLALDAGELDIAREAIVKGLRGLPGNEPLYRLRMTIEHTANNLAGVQAAYDELSTYLADLDTEPSSGTSDLLAVYLKSRSIVRY